MRQYIFYLPSSFTENKIRICPENYSRDDGVKNGRNRWCIGGDIGQKAIVKQKSRLELIFVCACTKPPRMKIPVPVRALCYL